jgi:hypothetical protein
MELKNYSKNLMEFYNKNINTIKEEFSAWLLGIEEDTPLPYEINIVTFIITKASITYSISYSGYEGEKMTKLTPGHFYPLEGQFFWSKGLFKLSSIESEKSEDFMLFMLSALIKNFLSGESAKFLKNRQIAIGFFYEKPIYINTTG